MSAPILVTYATRYGSTQEAAEAIATTLNASGFEADLLPVQRVHSIEGYRAVVVGAPLQIGMWHGDARSFLSTFRQALSKRAVAIFALGPLHAEEKEMHDARQQLDKELLKFGWLKPLAIQVFVGRFDPAKLRFPFSFTLKSMPATDEMDFEAIRAWARNLPRFLQLTSAEANPVAQAVPH